MNESDNVNIHEAIDPDTNYFEYFRNFEYSQDYLSVEELDECLKQCGSLKILSYNIRSFSANSNSFFSMFSCQLSYPDIISLNETWFHFDSIQEIEGYIGYHVTRQNQRSGGVSVYLKEYINSELIKELSFVSQNIEICTIRIRLCELDLFLLSIYRPHDDSVENFISCLEGILNGNILRNKTCILIGDFNINLLNNDSITNNFIYAMQSLHYAPLVSKPTRFPTIVGHNPSLIDHIWINDITKSYICRIVAHDMTDHCPIFLNLFTNKSVGSSESKVRVKFRCINDENKKKFEYLLSSFDWNHVKSNNVENYLENFMKNLNHMYCCSFPIKYKYVSHKNLENCWITPSIKKLIKTKSKYFKLYHLNFVTREENNLFRNKVKAILNRSKNLYFRQYFRFNQNNLRQSWKMIKSLSNFTTRKNFWKKIFFGTE